MQPTTDDIQQVVAYAVATGCTEAILVYPRPIRQPFDAWVGSIRVRSVGFAIDGDLDLDGSRFMSTVIEYETPVS